MKRDQAFLGTVLGLLIVAIVFVGYLWWLDETTLRVKAGIVKKTETPFNLGGPEPFLLYFEDGTILAIGENEFYVELDRPLRIEYYPSGVSKIEYLDEGVRA